MNNTAQIYDTHSARIQLTSLPASKRPGYFAVTGVYLFACAFVIVWYAAAWTTYSQSAAFATMILVINSVFAAYLFFSLRRLRHRIATQFVIEIAGDFLYFFELDKLSNERKYTRINLDEVVSCEYYPYQDSASLILTTAHEKTLDLPLWLMPDSGRMLVDHLKDRGFEILRVS
ncbi:MAG: hypothetical protein AB7W16_12235 [Candidatus Obscuribacterales bacterium]